MPTINEHLKNIFAQGEVDIDSVIRKFQTTAADGKNYDTKHYNLDAIISFGHRENSVRATQFRQWATTILCDFAMKGYAPWYRLKFCSSSFSGEGMFNFSWVSFNPSFNSSAQTVPRANQPKQAVADDNKEAGSAPSPGRRVRARPGEWSSPVATL